MKTLGSGALSFLLTFFLWASKEKMKIIKLHTPPLRGPPSREGNYVLQFFNLIYFYFNQHSEVQYMPELQSAGT